MRNCQKSIDLFKEAQKYIPGGVNSPVRAFKSVGLNPIFIEKGRGSKIFDVDGNVYIDYVGSWGPLILGHSHPKVIEALRNYLDRGTSYGAPTELETELAKMIVEAVPSVELVRMVNSGTEATMSALRLARGYTKRNKILKFEGCYHGHVDSLLIKAGSGALTHGVPTSLGIPNSVANNTIVAPYNDLEALERIFEIEGENIAAVIVEPIAGNMGVVLPQAGYLEGLRELTKKFGVLLIFDEVITGFRVAYGGVQSLYNIDPDLTCFGKIIGGGLPVGAYGGKKHIMEQISPIGPVYQAGTLSGNPLAMVAGIATLKILQKPGVYEEIDRKAKYLTEEIAKAADSANVKISLNRAGSMFCIFFTDRKVVDFASARASDTKKFAAFFKNMLKNGIYLAPSQFESTFVSLAHSDEDIECTIKASYSSFAAVKEL